MARVARARRGMRMVMVLDKLEATLGYPVVEAVAFFVGDGVFGVIGEADAVRGEEFLDVLEVDDAGAVDA